MKFRFFLQKFFNEKFWKKIMFVQIFQNRIQKRKNIVEREDTFQQYSEMFWNILITISISKYHISWIGSIHLMSKLLYIVTIYIIAYPQTNIYNRICTTVYPYTIYPQSFIHNFYLYPVFYIMFKQT